MEKGAGSEKQTLTSWGARQVCFRKITYAICAYYSTAGKENQYEKRKEKILRVAG